MIPEILAQQIAAHQIWLESRRLEGAQAVFKGQDLRFASLAGVRLDECVLTESNLERSGLQGIFLAGADLRKVNLAYANLTGADLSGANLSGARLEGASLDSADLRDALIEDAVFDSASLKNANLTAARGSRAKFNRADLSAAELDAAILQDGHFNGANLTQASLRETNLDRAQMRGASLSGAQLDGASLREAVLLDTILVGVSFESANIEGARLDRNALGGANPGDEDENGLTTKTANTKVSSGGPLFSGMGLTQNSQMAFLLRHRDELQQKLRSRLLQVRGDAAQVAGDVIVLETRAELDRVEADRRVLRQDIRRTEEHRRTAQGELQIRVEAATAALRSAASFANRQMRRALLWSLIAKTTGFVLIAAGAIWLLIFSYRLNQGIDSHFSIWTGLAITFFIGGLALLILDYVSGRRALPLIRKRDRIDDVIATLVASSHLSADVEANQANILETFEAARKILLAPRTDGSNGEGG